MDRIAVIGVTGSGKTTFARNLARHIDGVHIELDALHWEANWIEAPDEIFRERVKLATQAERWTVDGNYSEVRDIVWGRADTIVWLDYSFRIVLWRLTRRTFGRALRCEEMWNGNRENLRTHFFTRDSLFLWLFQTYGKRKKEYPELFARPEYTHLRIVHLRSTREAEEWLKNVEVERT